MDQPVEGRGRRAAAKEVRPLLPLLLPLVPSPAAAAAAMPPSPTPAAAAGGCPRVLAAGPRFPLGLAAGCLPIPLLHLHGGGAPRRARLLPLGLCPLAASARPRPSRPGRRRRLLVVQGGRGGGLVLWRWLVSRPRLRGSSRQAHGRVGCAVG